MEDPKRAKDAKTKQKRAGLNGLDLNVMMLAIDSTSKMNFIRHMPKSLSFLEEDPQTVVFNSYNIVGQATAGNMIPMLTGKYEDELPLIRKNLYANASFVDDYPLVWKEFENAGYVTMFAEDRPDISMFNNKFTGFKKQPTDHYMRTFWRAVDVHRRGLCVGSDFQHKIMLDYMKDYVTSYPDNLKFGLFFLSEPAHDDMNALGVMDEDLLSFLESMKQSGNLNKTLLILFGDHGAGYLGFRHLLQGRLEERLPFMAFILPPELHRSRPDIERNVMTNADRLTTPFDIHATLRSVIDFSWEGQAKRGISLLSTPVSTERRCSDADIPDHYCACFEYEEINQAEFNQVEGAVHFTMKSLNAITSHARDKCSLLRLSAIASHYRLVSRQREKTFPNVRRGSEDNNTVRSPDEPSSDQANTWTSYLVTIETSPGGGLFEATVQVRRRRDGNSFDFQLGGDISRINRYGHQADCIRDIDSLLTQYCFCRT
ncbi:uncharacterized protein [Diadema antillarum]|uniref:uncharacterized protein n=1 Tax=Diadema antillarum TaxID=105358 RepID=UPI003A892AB9